MTRPVTTRKITILALAALAVTAAACGKQGALERPAPLWDPVKKAAWEAERRAASAQANQPARAGGAQEVRDPASTSSNRTIRAAPCRAPRIRSAARRRPVSPARPRIKARR